jgi:hypothetical protein
MWQCGNAEMLEGAPCVAARQQLLRVVLRRPATHGRASYIAALPHFRITALILNEVIHTRSNNVSEPGNSTNQPCLLTRLPAKFILVDGIDEVVRF